MTVLVFGNFGQVATELQRAGSVMALGREDADLAEPEACAEAILRAKPHAVINATAYTAVDQAESDEELVQLVNGLAPPAMAGACKTLGTPFVHLSTDYVFSGEDTDPWRPEDATGPQNAYGRSKLAGEEAIGAVGGCYAILRTSWVFSAHGANFVKTMLRLSETRDSLSVVADQVGGPTPARAIAAAALRIATKLSEAPALSGVYHFSGAPDVSWADFAAEIFKQAGRRVAVTPIPTSEYPTPAKRPLNSRLDCRGTEAVFGLKRPDWRRDLTDVLTELGVRP